MEKYLGYALNSLNPFVLVAALVLATLTAVLFFGANGRSRHKGVLRALSNHFNFKTYWISAIARFLYALVVFTAIGASVLSLIEGDILEGLITLILAPLVFRLVFEALMTLISLRDESARTNDYLLRLIELNSSKEERE